MGKYINIINGRRLPAFQKAHAILTSIPGSKKIEPPKQWSENLVCVVENAMFDAAAHAYDEQEMLRFLRPDAYGQRPRTWLYVPNAKIYAE